MEKEYTYAAFISYSSKDEKVAKALWKKLEHYRLPAVLQKQYEDVPKKMHVFLDQGDITPGDTVENALSRELADSKKLIVICSPNSALSKYVELEVSNFLKLGHSRNDIIPYIIAGDVIKDNPVNCYVPSLYGEDGKDTINGVSVVRDGKWKAFVGVLANILDVKFDEIYRRERVRRNRLIAAWSALGAVAACFICMFAWYVTPHTRYYRDYVTRWGIPVGIYELDKKQVGQELEHYEITSRFGRPQKLVHANSKNCPVQQLHHMNHFNRPIIATFEYKNGVLPFISIKRWDLDSVHYEYNSGNLMDDSMWYSLVMRYSRNSPQESTLSFYYAKDNDMRKSLSNDFLSNACFYYSDISELIVTAEISELDSKMLPYPELHFLEETSSIYQFRIRYDDHGHDSYIGFYNYNDRRTSDRNSIQGINQTFDEIGRVIEQYFTFESSKSGTQIVGVPSSIRYKYDETGRLAFMGYFEYGTPDSVDNGQRGFSYCKSELSENQYSISFYDRENRPVDSTLAAVSSSISTIKNGLEIETETFSVAKKEKQFIESEYDPFGNFKHQKLIYMNSNDETEFTMEAFYDYYDALRLKELSSTITIPSSGEIINQRHKYTFEENNDGTKIIETVFFDDGTMETEMHYDIYGRKIWKSIRTGSDIMSGEVVYGGDNRSISFKNNGEYFTPWWNGYSQANFIYDNNNHLTSCEFKNENNEYVSAFIGFCKYEARYSVLGDMLSEVFKNEKNELICPAFKGYARMEAKESLDHNKLEFVSYSDENGNMLRTQQATANSDGSYYIDTISAGKLKKRAYYKKNGELEKEELYHYTDDGSWSIFYSDKFGRLAGSVYFDENGNKTKYRAVNYTEEAQIVTDYTNDDTIYSVMTRYIRGDEEIKLFYQDGNIHRIVLRNSQGQITNKREYDMKGNLISDQSLEPIDKE